MLRLERIAVMAFFAIHVASGVVGLFIDVPPRANTLILMSVSDVEHPAKPIVKAVQWWRALLRIEPRQHWGLCRGVGEIARRGLIGQV